MEAITSFKNVDIYLIDQILKGTIAPHFKILDAGCGSGRNLRFFAENGFNITGFDPIEEHITSLQQLYPQLAPQLHVNTIEEYKSEHRFDFIICSAVLHFSKDHIQFEEMFDKLSTLLAPGGTIFIRMTTTIGLETVLESEKGGVYELPDGTTRYLISRDQIYQLFAKNELTLNAPIKTVLVDKMRSMAVLSGTK